MENEKTNLIRVGSRKSELALIQTNFVIDSLKKVYPEKEFTIVTMDTLGDRILNVSLPKIGEKSLFTKDLEDALRNNTVDFVVHSLKDLPTTLPDGLVIGAVFEREDPRDALVLREDLKDHTLASLPAGSVIGTSSLRRAAQLGAAHAHLRVQDVRGNLNTRLRKLDAAGPYAALLLAAAGLRRMGWGHRISKVLPCSELLYAVGQGALAVECSADRGDLLAALQPFNHATSYCRVLAERSMLRTLGGGCSAPVGVSTSMKQEDDQYVLRITGAVWSLDGSTRLDHSLQLAVQLSQGLGPDGSKRARLDPPPPHDLTLDQPPAGDNTTTLAAKIYCGLTDNVDLPPEVISKCDNLGKELANCLIAKGALEVMKISQDYIRSNTANKS